MLPPMAIFFPLFTILEDIGFLPRIAYNLDKPFQCCRACGKQALTMCMGFGCRVYCSVSSHGFRSVGRISFSSSARANSAFRTSFA